MSDSHDEVSSLFATAKVALTPTTEEKDRVRALVETQIATPTAAPSPTSSLTTTTSAKVIAGLVLACAAAWMGLRNTPRDHAASIVAPKASVASVSPAQVAAAAPTSPRNSGADSQPTLPASEIVQAASVAKARRVVSRAVTPNEARIQEVDSIADTNDEDLALLLLAQKALRDGDAARALELVATHEHAFPQSAFRAEIEAISVMAHCALGDDARAKPTAAFNSTFHRRRSAHASRSVLVTRLRVERMKRAQPLRQHAAKYGSILGFV